MKYWQIVETHMKKLDALHHAQNKITYDLETIAPKKSFNQTALTLETLAGLYYEYLTDEHFLYALENTKAENLSTGQKQIVEEYLKEVNRIRKIPLAEYKLFAKLQTQGHSAWISARESNDFSLFAPVLEEIVSYLKRYATYQGYEANPYNALLDIYEPEMQMNDYDQFFGAIREKIVPLLARLKESKILQQTIHAKSLQGTFAKNDQEKLMHFIVNYVGFDFNYGQLGESAHPFSTSFHNEDIRITTRYDLQDVTSSIFSVLHEFGHGIYERNIAADFTQTPLGTGVSMGMHESQSRFYENMIGRTKSFWQPIYPVLQAMFPQPFQDVTLDAFILSINQVQPSLIRVEADELTYPLHIMLRYDLEKLLFSGDIQVRDLPQLWNEKMEEYLGLTPKTVSEGVLQDVHWSQGSFGYFPTYALGSAYAAQFYATMQKKVCVSRELEAGNLNSITSFLSEHIHQFGKSKTPKQIIKDVTGAEFSRSYYIKYLTKKYEQLFLWEQ